MMNLFSDDMRRNPYPIYDQLRSHTPLLHIPAFDVWMVFDYEGVRRVLSDHETFHSRIGPEGMLVFIDPPRHTKLRALISKAFTPRVVTLLEPRIKQLSAQLLDQKIETGQMDLAVDYSLQLPLMVIAEMIGMPCEDLHHFRRWSDGVMNLSYDFFGGEKGGQGVNDFLAVTEEMKVYVAKMIEERRGKPRDDLITKLMEAEVDGERLTPTDIFAFVQLLLVAGQETTTNLINNAVLCLVENPEAIDQLKTSPHLLPLAIEEVLRFRSPFQWTARGAKMDVEIHGQMIPAGKRVVAVIGSANRDPLQFPHADRFDITRDPNPHLAFGKGIHICLGAPLARLEARIALSDFLERLPDFERASNEPWEPRKGLNVMGPSRLPIRFQPGNKTVRVGNPQKTFAMSG